MIGQNFRCPENFLGYKGFLDIGLNPPVLEFEEGSSITLHDMEYGANPYAKTEICLAAFEGENSEVLAGFKQIKLG